MADEIKNTDDTTAAEQHDDKHAAHEYDGIVELTNPAPYWIILVLLATLGFSMAYVITYFGYPNNGKDQKSEYEKSVTAFAVEKAEMKKNKPGGSKGLDEKQMILAGQTLFTEKGCIACHGLKGEGNAVGPNLTDDAWINGCKEEQIIATITNGKPEKGMTPFKNMLSEDQIQQLAKYILGSLAGSNPPNPKPAQGVPCK
jgi:cytochrome c oxidase cbb3-type subunit 3